MSRPLGLSEAPAAAALLARAFADDPAFRFALPDEGSRVRSLEWMFERVLRMAWLRGATVEALGPGPDAVALWLEVAGAYDEPLFAAVRAGLALLPLVVGPFAARRLMRFSSAIIGRHRRHAPGRHVYLQLLAVAPGNQGSGLGSALLAAGLARADAARLPVYLETEVEKNVALYQRRGFAVVEHWEPIAGVPVWSMLRKSA